MPVLWSSHWHPARPRCSWLACWMVAAAQQWLPCMPWLICPSHPCQSSPCSDPARPPRLVEGALRCLATLCLDHEPHRRQLMECKVLPQVRRTAAGVLE